MPFRTISTGCAASELRRTLDIAHRPEYGVGAFAVSDPAPRGDSEMVKMVIIAAPRPRAGTLDRGATGKDRGAITGSMVSAITDERPAP